MNKLAVFDFDATLLDAESIDAVLAQIVKDEKTQRELMQVRAQGMRGDIELHQSLAQRIRYFKGTTPIQLEQICRTLPWMTNAKKTIAVLKCKGYFTLCLSGGFRTATRRVITHLGMDAYCSNSLILSNGVCTGELSGKLLHHLSKGKVLAQIQAELNITPANTLAVGDGANDVSMFAHAGVSIAFCAHQRVKQQASVVIENKDLSEVLAFAR